MFSDWRIECNDKGISTVTHEAHPRFTAKWRTGNNTARLSGAPWVDRATGEDDIQLFDFKWIDRPPRRADFRTLMNEAGSAIDGWIAGRL